MHAGLHDLNDALQSYTKFLQEALNIQMCVHFQNKQRKLDTAILLQGGGTQMVNDGNGLCAMAMTKSMRAD